MEIFLSFLFMLLLGVFYVLVVIFCVLLIDIVREFIWTH